MTRSGRGSRSRNRSAGRGLSLSGSLRRRACGFRRRWFICKEVEKILCRTTLQHLLLPWPIFLPERRWDKTDGKRCGDLLAREFDVDQVHGDGKFVTGEFTFFTDIREVPNERMSVGEDRKGCKEALTRCSPR